MMYEYVCFCVEREDKKVLLEPTWGKGCHYTVEYYNMHNTTFSQQSVLRINALALDLPDLVTVRHLVIGRVKVTLKYITYT